MLLGYCTGIASDDTPDIEENKLSLPGTCWSCAILFKDYLIAAGVISIDKERHFV